MKSVFLIGAFIETIELCEKCGYAVEGIFDNDVQTEYYGYPVIGTDEDLLRMKNKFLKMPLVIVPDVPQIREKLFLLYKNNGFKFETIVSPDATISRSAVIGEGSIIQDGCNISSKVKIGKCVRINSCANVMHESVIEDFATVAPNAVILGRCNIQKKAYIGANSTILPERVIEKDAIVGAAAVVTKNVKEKSIMVGNPARKMKELV